MYKYKDKYIVKIARDVNGEIYNRDDNYIACRAKGQIYRYSNDTLRFVSPHKIRIKNEQDGQIIWDYTNLIEDVFDTEEERVITFKEENLEKLEDLFKARKRHKRDLTDEQREQIRERLQNARLKRNNK